MKWFLFLFCCICCYAGPPNLSLPYSCGESMLNNMGYGGQGYTGSQNTHINNDYYAIDFTQLGCDPWAKLVLAAADGVVKEAVNIPFNGYGEYVLIDHGDGYQTKYCHLSRVNVNVGQYVPRGFIIGTLGNSGFNITSLACPEHPGAHLHFVYYRVLNGLKTGLKPEPLSGFTNIAFGKWYQSNNCNNNYSMMNVGEFLSNGAWHWADDNCEMFQVYSEPFATDYFFNDFQAATIYPISYVHESDIFGRSFWIQDFEGVGIGFVTMVYNPYQENKRTGCKGVVYHVQGRMRDYWLTHGAGIGPPVTNEYYLDRDGHRYTVQWFERLQSDFTAVCYDRDLGGDCFLGYESGLLKYGDLLLKMNEHNFVNSGCEDGGCGRGGNLVVDDFPYPSDTSLPSTGDYPFQYGFVPVVYDGFKFNGLVFGKTLKPDGDCPNVLDTGSVFKTNTGNIWCVAEVAGISGIFQLKMVFYQNNIFWWETDYSLTTNTGGNILPCTSLPLNVDCFNDAGKYQVEARIKFDGKEYSLCKRDLVVSGGTSVATRYFSSTANGKALERLFDISGRRLKSSHESMSGSGVIIGVSDDGVVKRRLLFVN